MEGSGYSGRNLRQFKVCPATTKVNVYVCPKEPRRCPVFSRLTSCCVESGRRNLTRFSHGLSTAAADPGMSTALRSVGFLDVLSSTPAESSRRAGWETPDAPCIHAGLRRLATKPREKSGLAFVRKPSIHHRDGFPRLTIANTGYLKLDALIL